MTPDTELPETSAGRQIELVPVPPGFWMIVGGCVVAALGPLFGFLIGSVMGSGSDGELGPIYLLLFAGIIVGGLGTGLAILGVRRLLVHRRTTSARDSDAREDTGQTHQGPAATT